MNMLNRNELGKFFDKYEQNRLKEGTSIELIAYKPE